MMFDVFGGEVARNLSMHRYAFCNALILKCKKTSSSILLEVEIWCPKTDSNRRPTAYKAVALPTELLRQEQRIIQMNVRLS